MRSLRSLMVLLVVGLMGGAAAPALGAPTAAAPMGRFALTQEAACTVDGFAEQPLEIMAPAAPGGGWDTTAREMQRVLQEAGIAPNVEVYNVEGAGGTVGIAQFVNDERGNDHQLMMMGLVMVGALATNASEVTLDDVTPVSRLTTEFEVIVVPADSEYQTLDDLLAAFRADPTAVSWGGGSAGGTDHVLVGLIAQAEGIDPTQINYVPFSGGGEALAAILGGQVSAGVSGVGEWLAQIESGELRALAVSGTAESGATPVAGEGAGGTIAPTLQEQGVDVELANWRGLVAPPEISPEGRDCLVALVDEMRASEGWQETLANYGWEDYPLSGDQFATFLTEERDRVIPILNALGLVA
ncbi:MAG: Tricarboxylate transport protein TctC [uncultured Thermomicrobiales bacterium]|uniref:Tricarboxylate transport protein TctC n=1 Tax=uncultured Thermomicrobiales bacterium TaxID=1645740 RepID=A0A6J4UD91_9BACT|nr:MAG: Tricarboxylate transport protein TctC [uncultured Thermomicrobiales bacterium]